MLRSSLVFAVSVIALFAAAGPSLAQSTSELSVGDSLEGSLTSSDPQASEDGSDYRYDDFRFSTRQGQRLEAILRSDDFDAYLEVRDAAGEVLASDDDGLGDGANSRLRFTAPAGATYTLRARTLSGLEGGAYSLSLSERPAPPRTPRPSNIRVGAAVRGSLGAGDAQTEEEIPYDAYAFRARAGQRFAVSLNSEAFDPVVRVGRMESGDFTELAMNDDAASGGLNSYLIFTAPDAGEYVLRAMPLSADAAGAYTLSLAEGPAPLPAQAIAVGDSVSGELIESDGLNDTGARADVYRFTGTAGQRIEADLKSDDFDAWLELYNASGESIDQDDDGGDDTNARLVHTLPADGEYTIQARALGDDETGGYTLSLAEGKPEPEPTALPFGEALQGSITDEDPRDDENRGFDAYRFSGTEGNRVQIIMRSGDFDTYLQVGRAGDAFEALSSDDDGVGEGTTDSRLNYILPETGDYIVRASPLGSEDDGLYSIEMTDRGPQPEAGSILVGATARGTLTDLDAISDDGAFFDAYAITVTEDEKLKITMVSNDFDAYIDIGREGDGVWTSVVSDDDSLSDTHAKVDWTVEEAGTYIIRARAFATAQTGAYALKVERAPKS